MSLANSHEETHKVDDASDPVTDSTPLLKINAQAIAIAHTVCSSSAFLVALIIGYSLHFHKIVTNEYYGYPDEWFPSVSATIGDRYPERSIFQILIALTSGPRFLLLFFNYIRLYQPNSKWPKIGFFSGLIRTVTCGGWVYITSGDDHDWHDIFMIAYIILTIPWDLSNIILSKENSNLKKYRKITCYSFFGTLFPLIYLFIQHKVHHVPGSYSYYAYCEWGLIILDIAFDAWSIIDFKDLYVEIRPSISNDDFFSIHLLDKSDSNSIIDEKENYEGADNDNEISAENLIPKRNLEFNSSYIQIAINIINSYMFWSIFTSLFLCIWYFPLWFMGISGYELVIVSSLSPIFLLNGKFKSYALNNPSQLRLVSCLLGIGCFIIPDPTYRLFFISAGNAFAFISLSAEIALIGSTDSVADIRSYSTTFMLGLTLSSLSKYAYWTNNPVWPILNDQTGGLNKIGLFVGLLSAYYTHIPSNLLKFSKKNLEKLNDSKVEKTKNANSTFVSALGLGSFFFTLLAMLTDSSTMILWTWDGYPVRGPTPVPHGAITLTIMGVGIYSGYYNSKFSKFITILGVIGSIILYSFHGWLGYFGAILYTFWLSYISPICFEQAAYQYNNISKFMFASFSITTILTLMHVWVVAYAFVPGGPLLRERTDIVLGLSTFAIALLIFKSPNDYKSEKITSTNDNKDDKNDDVFYSSKSLKNLSAFGNFIISFLLLSYLISFNRFQYTVPKPYHPNSRLVTAGIWTIHFGLDNDMWASEYRMRDLIRDAELDIVGLLESDTERIIMGNRDLTERLAEELNMYADYGPGPNKHTWGAALLSKFPILNSTHHLLPSPVGELAPAIHATLDMYGVMVDVVVFHSGQEEDEEDRRLQSLELQKIMGSSDRPMILLSYLVTTPLEGNYNTYVSEKSGMHDIDSSDDDRWCEYILYKNLKRTGYARISRGSITDTELQVGKFVVPVDTYTGGYSTVKVPEVWINKDKRFPSIFNGDGVRDHRYHVFDEPRYYIY